MVLDSYWIFLWLGIGKFFSSTGTGGFITGQLQDTMYLSSESSSLRSDDASQSKVRFISIGTMSVSEYALKRSVNALFRI